MAKKQHEGLGPLVALGWLFEFGYLKTGGNNQIHIADVPAETRAKAPQLRQ